MDRWAAVPLAMAALTMLVACTSGTSQGHPPEPVATADATSGPPPSTPSAAPYPTGQPPRTKPPANCTVTLGSGTSTPPTPIDSSRMPVPWAVNWYGNAALWVRLAPRGVLPAQRDGAELSTKFPWWRVASGALTISAQRLDGPSGGFRSFVGTGYGDRGLQTSSLIWPSPGCWRVTGTVAGQSLTFIAWVQPIA